MFSSIPSRSRLKPHDLSSSNRGRRHRSSSSRRSGKSRSKKRDATFRSASRPPQRACREALAEAGISDGDLASVEQGICKLRVANYSRHMKRLARHLRMLEGLGFETTSAMAALISTNNSLKDAISLMRKKEWDREERICRLHAEIIENVSEVQSWQYAGERNSIKEEEQALNVHEDKCIGNNCSGYQDPIESGSFDAAEPANVDVVQCLPVRQPQFSIAGSKPLPPCRRADLFSSHQRPAGVEAIPLSEPYLDYQQQVLVICDSRRTSFSLSQPTVAQYYGELEIYLPVRFGRTV